MAKTRASQFAALPAQIAQLEQLNEQLNTTAPASASALPQAPAPTHLKLRAGETLQIWLARDSALLCQSRRVRIQESPQWLAQHMLRAETVLNDGQGHLIARSGWVSLHADADADAEVICHAAPALSLLERLRSMLPGDWSRLAGKR